MRPGWEKADELLLDVFLRLWVGVVKIASLQAFNHLLAKGVFAVVLADGGNRSLHAVINLLLRQIFLRVASNAFVAFCGIDCSNVRIIRQEDGCATFSLAGEVGSVFGKAVVHGPWVTVTINNRGITSPLFKLCRSFCAQAVADVGILRVVCSDVARGGFNLSRGEDNILRISKHFANNAINANCIHPTDPVSLTDVGRLRGQQDVECLAWVV